MSVKIRPAVKEAVKILADMDAQYKDSPETLFLIYRLKTSDPQLWVESHFHTHTVMPRHDTRVLVYKQGKLNL